MTWKTDGFSVTGGMWTTTQQTSYRPAGCSRYVGRQPGKPGGYVHSSGKQILQTRVFDDF